MLSCSRAGEAHIGFLLMCAMQLWFVAPVSCLTACTEMPSFSAYTNSTDIDDKYDLHRLDASFVRLADWGQWQPVDIPDCNLSGDNIDEREQVRDRNESMHIAFVPNLLYDITLVDKMNISNAIGRLAVCFDSVSEQLDLPKF